MKKTILLFCVVFALLLAGCGNTPETSEPGTALSAAPGEAAFSLRVAPEDRNQAFAVTSFVETEDGYYYGRENHEMGGEMIYFCPRGGKAFYPLCSKPNCKHNDQNCNAYGGELFGYYDGALYAVSTAPSVDVVKMKLDGTDHETVASLEFRKDIPNLSYSYSFHHGKLFLQGTAPYDAAEQEHHLIVLDLKDLSLTDFRQALAVPHYSIFYKDKAYGSTEPTAIYDKTLGEVTGWLNDEKLVELDALTGEQRVLSPESAGGLYATDTTLYYFENDLSIWNEAWGTTYEKTTPGFRELDLETGAVKDCGLPAADIFRAKYDEDFIYAQSYNEDGADRTLYFISRDYKLVDQMELKSGVELAAVTSDRIFFRGSSVTAPISCYLDKTQIGSGELTLVPVETIG